MQNHMTQAAQYQQQNSQYNTAANGSVNSYGEQLQQYAFQHLPSSATKPHSNTQIISQNIAKINEKLL